MKYYSLFATFYLFLSLVQAAPGVVASLVGKRSLNETEINVYKSTLNETIKSNEKPTDSNFTQAVSSYYDQLSSHNNVTYSKEIYDQLHRCGNLTAVAYCATPLVPLGIKKGKTFECALDFCHEHRNEYEIVEIFTPEKTHFIFGVSGTGYIALNHKNKEIIVVFRGTMSPQDAFTDVAIAMIPYFPVTREANHTFLESLCDRCFVHEGFYTQLITTFGSVFPVVSDLKRTYPDYSLLVTGHSLGGAMAHLAGLEFSLQGHDPLVISLASPKIGNDHLCDFTDKLFQSAEKDIQLRTGSLTKLEHGYYRVVEKTDYVPLVPPTRLYAHAGLEFLIDETLPVPQPQRQVRYTGRYKYNDFFKNIRRNEIIKFDVIHAYQHLHYFTFQSQCLVNIIKNALDIFHIFH